MAHETIHLHGHIVDSLLLPKVLDLVLQYGGSFELAHIRIGKTREEPSDARIIVHAESPERLAQIIAAVQAHGAAVEEEADCQWQEAPADGVFPDDFYVTTHRPTEVRVHGKWVQVKGIEMDLGIRLDRNDLAPCTVPMAEVRKGDRIIIGHEGVRVTPLERPAQLDVFGFMGAPISSERPHGHLIAGIARRMQALRKSEAKILLAGGPAIIHGGGREPLAWLIDAGYFHVLFCGNALAAHDMEAHLYGTSLGLHLEGVSLAHHAGRRRKLAGHRSGDGRRVVPPGTGAPIGVEGMSRFLVCSPDHYQIAYEINPWMSVKRGADPTVARVQWTALVTMLEKNCGATLERIEPVAGLPDMVFTANAGIVAGRTVVLSQFRYKERRPAETPVDRV